MILELEFELGISSQFVDIHRKVCSTWNLFTIYIFFSSIKIMIKVLFNRIENI